MPINSMAKTLAQAYIVIYINSSIKTTTSYQKNCASVWAAKSYILKSELFLIETNFKSKISGKEPLTVFFA